MNGNRGSQSFNIGILQCKKREIDDSKKFLFRDYLFIYLFSYLFIYLYIYLFIYLFFYLLMNVYTGYNLSVKDTTYIIYNKIH